MQTLRTILIFVICFVGTGQVTAQEAPDPLVELTTKVIAAAFEKKDGINPFIRPDDPKPEKDSERVTGIKKFGEGFWFITERKRENPASPWAAISSADFKIHRVKDADGRLTEQVKVRLEAPTGVTLTDTRNGQRYRYIEWVVQFAKKDAGYLIESVTQNFTNDPGHAPGSNRLQ